MLLAQRPTDARRVGDDLGFLIAFSIIEMFFVSE